MLRVKNDWRNRLGRDRLETLLRICEEGVSVEDFNPDIAIDSWYNEKVRRLTAGPHNYPKKRKTSSNSAEKVVDLSSLTLTDLESDNDSV